MAALNVSLIFGQNALYTSMGSPSGPGVLSFSVDLIALAISPGVISVSSVALSNSVSFFEVLFSYFKSLSTLGFV